MERSYKVHAGEPTLAYATFDYQQDWKEAAEQWEEYPRQSIKKIKSVLKLFKLEIEIHRDYTQ